MYQAHVLCPVAVAIGRRGPRPTDAFNHLKNAGRKMVGKKMRSFLIFIFLPAIFLLILSGEQKNGGQENAQIVPVHGIAAPQPCRIYFSKTISLCHFSEGECYVP